MIARIRAWLDQSGPTPAAIPLADAAERAALRARIAELEGQLSKEQLTTAHVTTELEQKHRTNVHLLQRAETAEAEAARLRADHAYVTAARCECGGKPEEYWRTRTARAEAQAQQDRDNAIRLTDEIERLRLRAEEADRVVHIAEQLERAQ